MSEPTAVPTTSYVNVDAIVPPELRAECVAMLEKLEASAPEDRDVLNEALDLWVRVTELETPAISELNDIPSDTYKGEVASLIGTLTGSLALYDAFDAFGGFEHVAAALGRNTSGKRDEVAE